MLITLQRSQLLTAPSSVLPVIFLTIYIHILCLPCFYFLMYLFCFVYLFACLFFVSSIFLAFNFSTCWPTVSSRIHSSTWFPSTTKHKYRVLFHSNTVAYLSTFFPSTQATPPPPPPPPPHPPKKRHLQRWGPSTA